MPVVAGFLFIGAYALASLVFVSILEKPISNKPISKAD